MPTGIGGEIGWWCPSLDDSGNGTTTLNDLAGSNHGTLTNFAMSGSTSNWVADTDNSGTRCLAMDGTNDYVACGTSTGDELGTLSAFSFSCWFKIVSATIENGIFQLGNFAYDYGKFWLRQGPESNIIGGFNEVSTTFTAFAFTDTTAWHHLSAIYDGVNVKLYLDDVLKTTTAFSGSVAFGGKKTTVGGYYTSFETFGGRLDDVRVWARALMATENTLLASRRAYQPLPTDFESGMFGGMSGAMTGGMTS